MPVDTSCPSCGEEEHEVLRETPQHVTLRCASCGEVRTVAPRGPRQTSMQLVLSDGHRSWSERMDLEADEVVGVGSEFDLEGHRYLVTGIEREDGVSARSAPAGQLRTCYAKRFDYVDLKFTLNEGDVTRSLQVPVEPEQAVRIGEVMQVQERLIVVKALKSDQNRTVRRGFLLARNVRRVFCDPAPPGSAEGSILPVARRAPERSRAGPRGAPARRPGPRRR